MKGVKRSDQATYLEVYRDQHSSAAPVSAPVTRVVSSSVPGSPAHSNSSDQSKIAKLEKLIKNRL